MCIICIDFDRGALKPQEARRALREMRGTIEATHVQEIEHKLEAAEEAPASKPNS